MSENVIDPVRETLKNILHLTGNLVGQLREAGEDQQARSLIVWVATCLHIVLVKKQRLYKQNPFSPEIVRMHYYEAKLKPESGVNLQLKSIKNHNYITKQKLGWIGLMLSYMVKLREDIIFAF